LLDGENAAKLSGIDKNIIQAVSENFTPTKDASDARGVVLTAGKLTDSAARWDVTLLKDSFGKVFPDKSADVPLEKDEKSNNNLPADAQIFYLADKNFVPLYGFFVKTGDKEAADKIKDAIVHLSHQRMVRSIANDKSSLHGKITITPFRFGVAAKPCDADGKIITVGKSPIVLNPAKSAYEIDQNEFFGFEIANLSKKDLYITLLDIGSDGSVKIRAPEKITDRQDTGLKLAAGARKTISGESCREDVFVASAPAGIETFKIIATTFPVSRRDFEFLEMNAVKRNGDKSLATTADWTSAEINLEISSRRKTPQ
jgi:hypothetical protein